MVAGGQSRRDLFTFDAFMCTGCRWVSASRVLLKWLKCCKQPTQSSKTARKDDLCCRACGKRPERACVLISASACLSPRRRSFRLAPLLATPACDFSGSHSQLEQLKQHFQGSAIREKPLESPTTSDPSSTPHRSFSTSLLLRSQLHQDGFEPVAR